MENHPLTPMRDSDLVRVLGRQTEGTVALVRFATVELGAEATRAAMAALEDAGHRYAIVDAVTEAHLHTIGTAAAKHALVTGGSGVAMGLPANFRAAGILPERSDASALPRASGLTAVIAGSCSRATLGQIARAKQDGLPVLELDVLDMPEAGVLAATALDWASGRIGDVPIVIAASAPPEQVAELQRRLGREAAGTLVEDALATVAHTLVQRGIGRLVVADAETSGAVVSRLGVQRLRIGAEIDPGVPWTYAESPDRGGIHLALKSGNFGAEDFFTTAFGALS